MSDSGSEVLAITGPTASGKTAVAIEVAKRLGAEIISMDSRQVYRGMDIGTAKASPAQRDAIPHFGLDLVDPGERFSAGRFAAYARETIREIQVRGRLPILVGGTGFFLRALTHPIFEEPFYDPVSRKNLADALSLLPDAELHRWLTALDPVTAERLETWGGRQRLLRALELPLLSGRPLSWWHANSPSRDLPLLPMTFVLDVPRDILDQRIDQRVEAMVADGLVDEVSRLLAEGYDEHSPGMSATGYIELVPYVRGEIGLNAALDLVRRNTRAYARRQLTWLRRQVSPDAIHLDATRPPTELAEVVLQRVEENRQR